VRRGFTLIELLTIVAILAVMVTIGIGSIRSGQGAARVKGATRDVYAAIRHARSVALVTGQRVIVNYSNGTDDDEPIAKVEVISAKIMNVDANRPTPQPYYVEDYKDLPAASAKQAEKIDLVKIRKASKDGESDPSSDPKDAGETVEEVLFAPMNESVVKGMRLKVVKGEDASSDETDVQKSHRISVSSNVDWLLKLYKGEQTKKSEDGQNKADGASKSPSTSLTPSADEMTEPVSVVWQTNGAVDPHDVWIYADGKKPEEGLLLRIDRFGAVKVLNGDGRDDRD